MFYIGVDVSINSTGVCIFDDKLKKWKFVSFPANISEKQIQSGKSLAFQDFLHDDEFKVVSLERKISKLSKQEKKKQYSMVEILKLHDAIRNARIVAETIAKGINDSKDVKIGIEGFSYGSKGNSLIDIVGYSYLIRYYLNLITQDLIIVSPSEVKKFAGRTLSKKTGGANKLQMLDLFAENSSGDSEIKKSSIWKSISKNRNLIVNEKGTEIKKPFDDLIDAYFISHYIRFTTK